MKVFVWVLGQLFAWALDPNGGILDSHLFLYDRYYDLAEYHRFRGRTAKADRLAAIAEAYYHVTPDDDDEPEAAAMGDASAAASAQDECGEHHPSANRRIIWPGSIAGALRVHDEHRAASVCRGRDLCPSYVSGAATRRRALRFHFPRARVVCLYLEDTTASRRLANRIQLAEPVLDSVPTAAVLVHQNLYFQSQSAESS